MAPFLAFREFPMTLQFVHGGVDRDGAPPISISVMAASGGLMARRRQPTGMRRPAGLRGAAWLVDGHIHLDKSFVGDRWHPHQPVNSLRERLAVEKAAVAGAAPMVDRAGADPPMQCFRYGGDALPCRYRRRTGLGHLEAVREAALRCADIMRIQLVAFPQAGVMSCPGTAAVLEQALAAGVEVLGGIDPTTLDGDAEGQLALLFGLAERYGVQLDIHLHEPGETGLAQLLRIAARTRAAGLQAGCGQPCLFAGRSAAGARAAGGRSTGHGGCGDHEQRAGRSSVPAARAA